MRVNPNRIKFFSSENKPKGEKPRYKDHQKPDDWCRSQSEWYFTDRKDGGRYCTRPKGHRGHHECNYGTLEARWPQGKYDENIDKE